jgi:hypothetical protein
VLSEVSATGRSLVQRRPTECCAPVCDLETPNMRRRGPELGSCPTGQKKVNGFKKDINFSIPKMIRIFLRPPVLQCSVVLQLTSGKHPV